MVAEPKAPRNAKTQAKRDRIVETAMRHFAEHGYQGAKVEDIAIELGIAKGSIFQHFGSKAGLFLQAYKRAVLTLPAWLDAPDDVRADGFFATVRFWLERTEHLIKEDWIPNRVVLIGNYGTDLTLKREINRWLVSEDPYGTLEFVEWGQRARRGPGRRRPRDHRLDGRLALELAAGRPGHRGTRPGAVPPAREPARASTHARGALHACCSSRRSGHSPACRHRVGRPREGGLFGGAPCSSSTD